MAKLEDFTLPDRGFVFWPVGSGDSTTIVIDGRTRHASGPATNGGEF